MGGTSRSKPALSEIIRSVAGSMAISGFVFSEAQQRAALELFEEELRWGTVERRAREAVERLHGVADRA